MSEIKKSTKFKKVKIIAIIIGILVLVGTGYLYNQAKIADARRAEFQIQREELINFWTEQGMSEEEIQDKLREQAPSDRIGQEPSAINSVLRTVRHTTGTGPGTGMAR